jgi:hypothetical protein
MTPGHIGNSMDSTEKARATNQLASKSLKPSQSDRQSTTAASHSLQSMHPVCSQQLVRQPCWSRKPRQRWRSSHPAPLQSAPPGSCTAQAQLGEPAAAAADNATAKQRTACHSAVQYRLPQPTHHTTAKNLEAALPALTRTAVCCFSWETRA